jgi:hypothetical protein
VDQQIHISLPGAASYACASGLECETPQNFISTLDRPKENLLPETKLIGHADLSNSVTNSPPKYVSTLCRPIENLLPDTKLIGHADLSNLVTNSPPKFVSTLNFTLSKPKFETVGHADVSTPIKVTPKIETVGHADVSPPSEIPPNKIISTAFLEFKTKPEKSIGNADLSSASNENISENDEIETPQSCHVQKNFQKKLKRKRKGCRMKENKKPTLDCNNIEIVHVRRVHFSKSSSMIPIQIHNTSVSAVLDSGAQVTILSDKIYNSLAKKPPVMCRVKLRMADGSTLTDGKRVGPVKMKIGDKYYQYFIIVAPLAEDMLLGHDILKSGPESTMDFLRGVLYFDGQIILTESENLDDPETSEISTIKRIKIPAGSIRRIVCKMNTPLNNDYIIETFTHLKVIAPKILRKAGDDPIVCLLNPRDRPVVIQKGKLIGRAFPVESVSEDSSDPKNDYQCLRVKYENEIRVRNLSKEGEVPYEDPPPENSPKPNETSVKPNDNSVKPAYADEAPSENVDTQSENPDKKLASDLDIPEHLTQTFWSSAKNLSTDEKSELAELLN